MLRKRRDKERDPSTSERLLKAGTTALALGAGAVFFNKSRLGKTLTREISPALLQTGRNFKKELLGKDKTDLMVLGEAFEKTIGRHGEIFKDTLRNKKLEPLNIDFTTSALYKNLLDANEFFEKGFYSKLKEDYKKSIQERATQEVIQKHIASNLEYKNITDTHIKQIVESTFDSLNDKTIDNNIIKRKINKTFNTLKIKDADQDSILRTINDIKNQYYTKPKFKAYVKENKDLPEIVKRLYYEKNFVPHHESYYNKIDKLYKTFTNRSLDSEIKFRGSKAVTVRDFLEDYDNLSKIVNIKDFEYSNYKLHPNDKYTKNFNFLNELKKLVKENEEANNLIVSKGLRKTVDENGNVTYFNTQENVNFLNKIQSKFEQTLPYRILFKGLDHSSRNPDIYISTQGSKSSLASLKKLTGQESETDLEKIASNKLSSFDIFINGLTYSTTLKDGVYTIEKDNPVKSKLLTGYKKKEYYSLLGHDKYAIPEASTSTLSKLLDINQDGEFNIINTLKRMTHKFTDEDWEFNSVTHVENVYLHERDPKDYIERLVNAQNFSTTKEYVDEFLRLSSRLHQDEEVVAKQLEKNISGITDETLNILITSDYVSPKHKRMLEALSNEDINEFLKEAIHNNTDTSIGGFENERLNQLIYNWMNHTKEMTYSIKETRIKAFKMPLLEMSFDENNQLDALGQLKVETVKDILLNLNEGQVNDSLFNWIDSLNLSDKESYILKDISLSAIFNKETQVDTVKNFTEDIGGLYIFPNYFAETLNNNPAMRSHFEANIGTIKSKYGPLSKGTTYNLNEKYYNDEEKYAIIKKSSIGEILTFNINEGIKFNGQAAIDTLKELVAGRNNPEHITDLTIGSRYLFTRLNYGMKEIGLGLSDESLGSTPDVIKNILLKRVLPIMAVAEGLNVLNYESEKITGVSLKGATANAIANVDLNTRRILDKTHISSGLNYLAETSVISEYLTGDREFKTEEEERKWYQDGYSPVRSGRFWSFGSSSEFRGGSITYYQPNFLKRAHSNYHDISVYGSEDEKWAHSWIPTPQHPFSTVRAFLDPYWLERKHLKENDRPYPLTGKMFSEGTFWGSILNPTIGEVLKPVKMLPEAKRRLGKNGIDAVSSIERLNTRIKQRGNENDDLLVVEGTDIRNAEYIPYGHPENDEVNVSIKDSKPIILGQDFMTNTQDIRNYQTPDGITFTDETNNYNGTISRTQKEIISKSTKFFTDMQNTEYGGEQGPKAAINIIQAINQKLKQKGNKPRNISAISNVPNKQEGTFVYRNLVNERDRFNEDYYARYDTKKMVNKSKSYDYAKDLLYSQKQVQGIYGYLAEQFFGSKTYTYRYENAGKMSSFTRSFWDASIGGLGGGPMEIARRFFPSEDKSRVNINPLRNNMPDWIPDSYHYGDPYTNIPKGEMRLPGKGYESLNQLHPDQFGEYGAYDRFKILADIAPNSTEYKTWKSIAQNTVEDPNLRTKMEDISVRVAKMSGNHEFFNYNYIHTNTKYEKGIVKAFNNGQIILQNNKVLTLAGVITNQNADNILAHLLTPGEKINYKTYKNNKVDKNGQSIVEAVVFGGDKHHLNINQQLVEQNGGEKNKEDFSPLAVAGNQSGMQEVLGAIQEVVAHAKIPVLHNKFLKIETPFESYKSETYYGSNFKTWEHPIKGFIKPAFNEQSGKSLVNEALSLGYAYLHFSKIAGKTDSKLVQYASNVVLTTLNPSAFIGGSLAYGSRLATGKMLNSGGSSKSDFQIGAEIGTIIGTVKWGWDNADNPIKSAAAFSIAGMSATKVFKNIENFSEKYLGKSLRKVGFKEGALVGSLIGLGVSAVKNSHFDKDKMFKPWVPKDTKKKWDLDEYFDRLNYIKYSGLYKVASARAALFEKSNIRSVFKDIDKNKKKLAKLNREAIKLAQKDDGNTSKHQEKLDRINEKRLALQEQNRIYFKGGKYTKAAVAYKKKMESTIYGLDETATKDELLASVPDQYKDHFRAFMDITNESEQKKILKYMPEYLQRPLQIAWGQKPNKVKSNRIYFKNHKLPSMAWKGWKPNVNLKHVKMKTIENEGMLFSDFGYYESEKSKPSFAMAPSIKDYDKKSGQFYRTNLMASLHGFGINLSNVSVEPTSAPGMWIVGDVKDTASDIKNASSYKINSVIQTLASQII